MSKMLSKITEALKICRKRRNYSDICIIEISKKIQVSFFSPALFDCGILFRLLALMSVTIFKSLYANQLSFSISLYPILLLSPLISAFSQCSFILSKLLCPSGFIALLKKKQYQNTLESCSHLTPNKNQWILSLNIDPNVFDHFFS